MNFNFSVFLVQPPPPNDQNVIFPNEMIHQSITKWSDRIANLLCFGIFFMKKKNKLMYALRNHSSTSIDKLVEITLQQKSILINYFFCCCFSSFALLRIITNCNEKNVHFSHHPPSTEVLIFKCWISFFSFYMSTECVDGYRKAIESNSKKAVGFFRN